MIALLNLIKRKPVEVSDFLFTTCHELTLEAFEQCFLTGELSSLIKDKKLYDKSGLGEQVLHDTWEELQTEYCDLSADENFKSYLNKKSREFAIQIKMHHVKTLCVLLSESYDEGYVEILRKYGYRADKYKLDIAYPETYLRDLNRICLSLVQDEIKLKGLQNEIKIHTEKNKGAEVKQGYFDAMLIEIEKHMGRAISKEITVAKYCGYLHSLRSYIEAKNKAHG